MLQTGSCPEKYDASHLREQVGMRHPIDLRHLPVTMQSPEEIQNGYMNPIYLPSRATPLNGIGMEFEDITYPIDDEGWSIGILNKILFTGRAA